MDEPKFLEGERVKVLPLNVKATVIRQRQHVDGTEMFWGDVELLYDDGVKGLSHCWQLEKTE